MDPAWIAHTINPAWLGIAFLFGIAVRRAGLPPLVGFLIAGFVLNAIGVRYSQFLQHFSDMGVTLLLFTVGLKLHLNSLSRPQVWAVASVHMLITVLIFAAAVQGLGMAGLALFTGLDMTATLLLGFALSFSSTVFAVKVLDEQGEIGATYGRIAIGILIMQDIAAVIFLGLSTGKVPSPWALLLLGLIPLRPLLMKILDASGHGELLVLFGLVLALGGAQVFELAHVKGDLGALILGALLAGNPKANELAGSLLGFKDLFLLGFFVSIGLLYGVPDLQSMAIAALLAMLVVPKVWLFFWLLTRFGLRVRTSMLSALSLANYSEFGLIVGAIAAANGWIGGDWLVVIAIALSLTFIVGSSLNSRSHNLYTRYRDRLKRWESRRLAPGEKGIDTGDATIALFGMGRVGTGAYESLRARYGDTLIAADIDTHKVEAHRAQGRNVIRASATDPDFWDRIRMGKIELVVLTLPRHSENLFAVRRLKATGFEGMVAAAARYPDEIEELKEAGVDAVFNFYAEAGAGLAEHVSALYYPGPPPADSLSRR
jgi:glutathione-regulated potassium-efflux system ancillary protein KefC